MANETPKPPSGVSAPVHFIPGDNPARPPRPGMGLCLSGGGYRAMLFHLGAIIRLNHAAILSRLRRISSVSGGSFTARVRGLQWQRPSFAGGGRTQLPA